MIDLFKSKKNYPEYWKTYEATFREKQPKYVSDIRFVVFDTETTGFDFKKDRILSIGAVTVKRQEIHISDSLEIYVKQQRFNPETVEIHGIIRSEKVTLNSEEEAVKIFLEYIGNAVLVAHHAQFDIRMMNEILKRLDLPQLKNKVLDTVNLYRATRITSNLINTQRNYTLDEIAENLDISVKDRHTAAGDAMITAIAFMKIIGRLGRNGSLKLYDLMRL
ncbi:3'-5' exonuclease [Robertkochia aurantiaca]|uniref:3'-5' exonuclease n=1 Tax=Robertkochia aurantiaca TaxID=2873700 RepID=UPI001CCB25B4|nr:3'-5' exonuclease [Robertkochia sp. 3YJGBD-33]